ncbi:ThiF family adenylyltransferase [Candidatus Spongiisocius sp.]|uniref:ThiF family adenylyltransferase n=1 Tax=Candidatus Spongiisocius sp. TaxID=3101273 RepID=UPI003B5C0E31
MPDLAEAQRSAVEEMKRFTDSSDQIDLIAEGEWRGYAALTIEIDTTGFARRTGGLQARPRERVTVLIASKYPTVPPQAAVDHRRWAGFPHVLLGIWLCIYLDPGTEWDPTRGIQGFLVRLWEWFEDAIGGRFDAATALYHPVGGVLHRTEGAPTVVATLSMPGDLSDGGVVRRIGLWSRADHRVDIASWASPSKPGLVPGLLVVLPEYLPLGGGNNLSDLLTIVRQQLDRKQRRVLETSFRRLIRRLGDDGHLYVIIAVPSPAGDKSEDRHLIGWRLRTQDATESLAAARSATSQASNGDEPPVEWTYVDDQRPEIAVRRDNDRPVAVYTGTKIAVWGCGALGSWIAELLVRAGARYVILRDPGFVTRGLLVRQNYAENDVGRPKAEALADRLRRLSDDCEIIGVVGYAETGLLEDADSCDFIVDTSVNTAVSAAVDGAQRRGTLRVPVVQASTDDQTATLGVVTVTDGTPATTTSDLDQALRRQAVSDPRLTALRTFWDRDAHPPLTPARGCSVPTFHGSGADAMGIAASAISVAAIALSRQIAGGYLISLPHSPYDTPALTCVEQ